MDKTKKVVYKLKFDFEKIEDPNLKRDNNLNIFLSEIEDIISESPIQSLAIGSIIEISGVDHSVLSSKTTFKNDDDSVHWTTTVLLRNVKIYNDIQNQKRIDKEKKEKSDEDAKKSIFDQINKYKKYEGYQKYIYEREREQQKSNPFDFKYPFDKSALKLYNNDQKI
jgi:lipopolysaccharide export LptBFGC system permease protein LptF